MNDHATQGPPIRSGARDKPSGTTPNQTDPTASDASPLHDEQQPARRGKPIRPPHQAKHTCHVAPTSSPNGAPVGHDTPAEPAKPRNAGKGAAPHGASQGDGRRRPATLGRAEGWSLTGSNRRHPACKAGALPAELRPLGFAARPQGSFPQPQSPPDGRAETPALEHPRKTIPPAAARQPKWWAWEDLNFRPHAYQARALTN